MHAIFIVDGTSRSPFYSKSQLFFEKLTSAIG